MPGNHSRHANNNYKKKIKAGTVKPDVVDTNALAVGVLPKSLKRGLLEVLEVRLNRFVLTQGASKDLIGIVSTRIIGSIGKQIPESSFGCHRSEEIVVFDGHQTTSLTITIAGVDGAAIANGYNAIDKDGIGQAQVPDVLKIMNSIAKKARDDNDDQDGKCCIAIPDSHCKSVGEVNHMKTDDQSCDTNADVGDLVVHRPDSLAAAEGKQVEHIVTEVIMTNGHIE